MPRIKQYSNESFVNTGSLESAAGYIQESAYYRGKAWESGFNDISRGVGQFGEAYGKVRAGELATKISEIDTEATVEFENAKRNGAMDDPEFSQKFTQEHVLAKMDKLRDGIETQQEQDLFDRASNQLTSEYRKRTTIDQISYTQEKAVQGWADSTANAVNATTIDPSIAAHQAEMSKLQVETLSLSKPDKEKLLRPRIQAIYGASATGMVNQLLQKDNVTPKDVENLRAMIADPKNGFVDNMDPDTFAAVMSKIAKVKDTSAVTQSEIAKLQWPKIIAALKQGDPQAVVMAQGLMQNFVGATDRSTAVERARMSIEAKDAMDFFEVTKTIRDMPQPEIDSQYAELKIKAQAGDKNAAAAVEAADTRNKEFHRDPVGYVTQISPMVAAAAAEAQKNPSPQTFARYAATAAGEQEHLYPNLPPKVLSVGMKQQVQAQFSTIEQTPEGATKAGKLLLDLREQTGGYFNNAMHELMADHIVTAPQFAAGQLLGRPESQALGLEILRASAISGQDMWNTSGIPQGTAISAMQKALAPLMATFSETTNGYELGSAYVQAGANVMRARGKVDSDSAQALANTMFMGRFNIRNNLRIPKDFDDVDVAVGTENVQANIRQHDLVPPPSFSGFGEGLQQDAYKDDVQNYGHWITNAKGDGAMLRDQYNQPVYEKRPTSVPNFNYHSAPGMKTPGNLDPWNRPVLKNADGSYSTTSSLSIGTDAGETLIPTVVNGKRLSKEEAVAHFRKTGENFGSFSSPESADKFATAMHNAQATMFDKHGNRATSQVPVTISYDTLQRIGRGDRGVLDKTRRFFTDPASLDSGGAPKIPNANDIAAAPL